MAKYILKRLNDGRIDEGFEFRYNIEVGKSFVLIKKLSSYRITSLITKIIRIQPNKSWIFETENSLYVLRKVK